MAEKIDPTSDTFASDLVDALTGAASSTEAFLKSLAGPTVEFERALVKGAKKGAKGALKAGGAAAGLALGPLLGDETRSALTQALLEPFGPKGSLPVAPPKTVRDPTGAVGAATAEAGGGPFPELITSREAEALAPSQPEAAPAEAAPAPAPVPTPQAPTQGPVTKERRPQRDIGQQFDPLLQGIQELGAEARTPPEGPAAVPFTGGEAAAAGILAGLDPEAYRLIAAPELKAFRDIQQANRQAEQRARQQSLAALGLQAQTISSREGLLLDQEQIKARRELAELEIQQESAEMDTLMDVYNERGAALFVELENLARSEALPDAEMQQLSDRFVGFARVLDTVALNPTTAGVKEVADSFADTQAQLKIGQARAAASDEKISEKVSGELRVVGAIRRDASLALQQLDEIGDIGGPFAGRGIGRAVGSILEGVGISDFATQLQTLDGRLSRVSGRMNRELGGGGQLTEMEFDLLGGVFISTTETFATKRAKLVDILGYLDSRERALTGAGPQLESEIRLIRLNGGVLTHHDSEGNSVFTMPNGEVLRVTR